MRTGLLASSLRPIGPAFASVATALLVATTASAQIVQPDGTQVPVGGLLQTTFNDRDESIDAVNDAAITPVTFEPSCALTFEVLIRNAGYRNSFGWYNVTGSQPPDSDLYEFLTCTDDVGTQRVLDIRSDERWAGGEVGFYQATGPCGTIESHEAIFFSETQYNPDGAEDNPFVHLLIYNSTVTPRAFYFGWEDLLSGGDNDFDDLTTFVTGLTCSGGGDACTVDGASGVCAAGVLQCRAGELQCVATVEPQTEACDGFDNDCNEQIDEGDLCEPGEVCDRGACVPQCGDGEFTCTGGLECDRGFCVDPECVGVDCEEGERCIEGECAGPCEGVVCPFGQVCQLGSCLDPCVATVCDDAQVCDGGVCVDRCQCKGCDEGFSCADDGACIATACADQTCDEGSHCEGGECVDDCDGVTCPHGQSCSEGTCAAEGEGGGSGATTSGIAISVGVGGDDTGGVTSAQGTPSGAGGDGGASSGGAPVGEGEAGPGCDCTTGPGNRSNNNDYAAFALVGLGALVVSRRKRAQSRPAGLLDNA